MPKPKDLTNNEQEFVVRLLRSSKKRVDGRRLEQMRDVNIQYGESYGHVEVTLGNTRLVVRISAEATKPFEDRPYEGMFLITTDISAMASPMFENNRQSDEEAHIARLIEKAIRRSNALDLESLCISSGRSCWLIRADVQYLNYDGGLVDATCIGVIAGLLHFKRPDTSIDGEKTIIYSMDERTPVGLSVLHVPICVTFSVFSGSENSYGDDDGNNNDKEDDDEESQPDLILVDATAQEEAVRDCAITFTMNKSKDLCQLSKPGGPSIEARSLIHCGNVCFEIAKQVTDKIYTELNKDTERRNATLKGIQLSAENKR